MTIKDQVEEFMNIHPQILGGNRFGMIEKSYEHWLRTALITAEQKGMELGRVEERERYDDMFAWLLGEHGDFPDLSQKPHYRFRTELRERMKHLDSYQPNQPVK